ncbi:MAG: acetylxylan esterase [Armatimonadetes bacterium]|nr:acetylxylan esterase [Armatimonadota bacterium]
MNASKSRYLVALALLLGALARPWAQPAPPAAPAPVELSVVTDKPAALYTVGEQVRFMVTLRRDGAPAADGDVAWQLDKDGVAPVTRGTVKVANGSATVTGSLAEPGFLACRLTYTPPGGKAVTSVAGAGFEPEKIKPSLPVPDDFDTFWAAQKAKLRAQAAPAALKTVPSPSADTDCFDVQIPCLDWRPVSAYLAKPKDAKPGSLPIILSVHGAGVRGSSLGGAVGNSRGYRALSMDLNANGIANGKPDAWYTEMANGDLRDYRFQGRDDREKCYFLGMFLRLVRALDYLCSQPEWDGKHVIVTGGSQGGGQSLAAAGLDPRVTLICAGVPAICDHSGKVAGRINGWPKLVPDVDGKPDPKILEVARYFDCMNLATRSKARAVLSVGFIDTVCPPSSVYAAYNALPGTKDIVCEPLMGHASTDRIGRAFGAAMRAHLQ